MSAEGDDPLYDPTPPEDQAYTPTAGVPDYQPTYLSTSGGSESAQKNRAKVARAEFEDWKTRFRPVEQELIGQIGDPGVYRENVDRATESVDTAFTTGAGETQRNLSRYGVQPSAIESTQQQRQYGLSKAKATAEAANRSRSAVKNREMQVMAGGLAPRDIRNQQG